MKNSTHLSNGHRAIRAAVAALILVFAAGCATAPRYPERPSFAPAKNYDSVIGYLEKWIPAYMAEKNIPGLGIALVDESGVVWAKGFGFANKEKRIPFTADTRSNIGSVSKLFTCAAIMKLVEEGKIDLDQPLDAYLPEFSIKTHGWPTSGITIRRLLTQHSGLLSDRLKEFLTGDVRPADYPDTFLKLPSALAEEYAGSPPDTVFSYSNIAYSLLGNVVARVSGKSFADQIWEAILAPLGMKDSSFLMTDVERAGMALGYLGGKVEKVPYLRDLPAGSLVSTAADMGRFVSAMTASSEGESDLLQTSTVREMWRKQNIGVPLDFDFGVGLTWWQVYLPDLPGVPLVGHGGDLDAFHALLAVDPEHKIGAFIMVNGIDGIGSFSLAPVAALAFRGMIESKGGTMLEPPRPRPSVAPLPADQADRVVGYYATPQGIAQVKVEGGKLKVFAFGNWLEGVYHDDGTASLEARILFFKIPIPVLEEIAFTFEPIGDEIYLNMRVNGTLLAPCQKIAPVAVPESWLKRSGKYRVENPDPYGTLSDVSLALDRSSGFFMLEVKVFGSGARFPLQPVSNTEARLMGVGRNLGETIRIVPGAEGEKLVFEGFVLSKK